MSKGKQPRLFNKDQKNSIDKSFLSKIKVKRCAWKRQSFKESLSLINQKFKEGLQFFGKRINKKNIRIKRYILKINYGNGISC